MMKKVCINFNMINSFNLFSGSGNMFCYCCGIPIYTDGDNCETDRFGRSFCSEECRKIYYGGKAL